MNQAPKFNFQFSNPIVNPYGMLEVGKYSIFNFVDLDNDGDLDAFAGERYGDLYYFENTGSSQSPQFSVPLRNPFGLTGEAPHSSPEFVDFDNDGDLDAFVGAADGNIHYAENIGSASNPSFAPALENPLGFVNVEFSTTPTFADLDNDGDLDAFVGSVDGKIYYYQNTGNSTQPLTLTETNPFGITPVENFSYISFGDVDGDADLDAIMGARDGNLYYLKNIGTVDAPVFADPVTNPFNLSDIGDRSTPTFTDLDGDGGMDLAVGSKEGSLYYFRNNSTSPMFSLSQIQRGEVNNAGSRVSDIIPDGVISDPDGVVEAIAITGVDNKFGTWQYSLDGGQNWLNVGEVSDGSALLLDSEDLVRFVPRGRFVGSADFNFRLWDGSSGEAGQKFDVRDNGGETAFSQTVAMASVTVAAVNNAPQNLSFKIANPNLAVDRPTLTLAEGWVYDAEGAKDLASVDFWLTRGTQRIELADVTNFKPWSGGNQWANFAYSLNMNEYGPGIYTLYAQAYDQEGLSSNIAQQTFSFNSLIFGVGKGVYIAGETINLTSAWIYDPNGSDNLDFIDFALRSETGAVIDLEDVTEFTPWSGDDEWSEFSYSIDTSTIERGNYTLIATAFDQSGNITSTVEKSIVINNSTPPTGLEFYLPQTQYMVGDTLEVLGGWIYDADGAGDLSSIDFMLTAANGEKIDVANVTSFTPWDDNLWASFTHSIDTSGYKNGSYTLSAKAYDAGGDMSKTFTRQIRLTNSNPPSGLQFQANKFQYLSSESLNIVGGRVIDVDDASDIASIDFWVRKPNGEWVDVGDADSFTTNGQTATFNYNLDLVAYNKPGAYTLWGQAYDQGGDTSNSVAVAFRVNNSQAPDEFQYGIGRSQYINGDVLNINEGWVYDADGADTIASIDFWLQDGSKNWIDVDDVTSFEAWDQNTDWAKFEYNLDLVGYEAGKYTLWGQVYDKGGDTSAPLTKKFELFNSLAPEQLNFTLDKSKYLSGETLNLSTGWVYDGDGAEDLASVDFWLKQGNEWTNLADATEFEPYEDGKWADFQYSLDLSGYKSGTYGLWGQAYDQGGDVSKSVTKFFEVNASNVPEDLQFSIGNRPNYYSNNDSVDILSGWVKDLDGADDLASIDLWIRKQGGQWQDLDDIVEFTAWSGGSEWAQFEGQIDIDGYAPGVYTIWAAAYDMGGDRSNIVEKTFRVFEGDAMGVLAAEEVDASLI